MEGREDTGRVGRRRPDERGVESDGVVVVFLRRLGTISRLTRRIESSSASVLSVGWWSGSSVGQFVYASGRC